MVRITLAFMVPSHLTFNGSLVSIRFYTMVISFALYVYMISSDSVEKQTSIELKQVTETNNSTDEINLQNKFC